MSSDSVVPDRDCCCLGRTGPCRDQAADHASEHITGTCGGQLHTTGRIDPDALGSDEGVRTFEDRGAIPLKTSDGGESVGFDRTTVGAEQPGGSSAVVQLPVSAGGLEG